MGATLPAGAMLSLGGKSSVSVDDLSRELQRHCQSPDVATLLKQLRERSIDLREFCRRVRMLLGSEVLMQTVKGLQQGQKEKADAKTAVQGSPAPTVSAAANPKPAIKLPEEHAAAASTCSACAPSGAGSSTSAAALAPSLLAPPPPVAKSEAPPLPRAAMPTAELAAGGSASAAASATVGAGGGAPLPPLLPPAAPTASKSSSASSATQAAVSVLGKADGHLGTKCLIHALLCPRESSCPFNGCLMMKSVLRTRSASARHARRGLVMLLAPGSGALWA